MNGFLILLILLSLCLVTALIVWISNKIEYRSYKKRFITCNKCRNTIDRHKTIHYRQIGRMSHSRHVNGESGNSKYHILCSKCYNKRHINHKKLGILIPEEKK